jgi:NADH-quinone oxidoreductase subunit H
MIYLMGKAFFGYFIVMWVRSTLPRIRIDHMLGFNWKFLVPVTLALLMITAVLDKIFASTVFYIPALFAGNVLVFAGAIVALRIVAARQRKARKPFKRRPVAKPA